MSHHGCDDYGRPEETPEDYREDHSQHIAIIGMACRFPGADTPGRFWSNLINGVDSITRDTGSSPPGWVAARSVLDRIDEFDAEFFGYSPREAALLDPQHRLFLEVCWEALEDGGVAGRRGTGDIGVYGGCGTSLYLMNNLGGQASKSMPNFLDSPEDLQLAMASDRDYLTSRVSYKFDLGGPSVNVQAACATSLYALHLACQALLSGECDLALAGAAHVPVPQINGYQPEPGLVLSEDGHCRAFDARATGTVFGSGAGVVLLKPLDRALADGDRVYAVVRGTAVNNDGAGKPGFSAPSVSGQAAVIRQALAAADVEPGSISYVEAHGTGTPAGDPIEVAALTEAFRGVARGTCALGSVKTNIGHLGWAAGVAGLIKVALALWHRVLPASLHFHEPNPAIDFTGSPFFVQSETTIWPSRGAPRRAGVSAFGLGGMNAHAVLEEAPAAGDDVSRNVEAGFHVLPVSGRTAPALRELAARVGDALLDQAAPDPADAAFTLGAGRRHFAHRVAVVGSDRKTLAALLEAAAHDQANASGGSDSGMGLFSGLVRGSPPPLIALFSGQGAEYLEACRDLYVSEPVFRRRVDGIDPLFQKHTGRLLSEFLYRDRARRGLPIADIRLAQPVNYALQAALLDLWRGWGCAPDVHIGHSLGEYAAAYGAGVFDFETGLNLVCERGRLLSTLPEGGMAAVFAGEHDVLALLEDGAKAGIAAINAPRSVVISGERSAVRDVIAAAEKRGVKCKELRISRAGHSPQIDAILDGYSAVLESADLRPPTRTIISTLTGAPIGEEIAKPEYWLRQLRHPVRFLDAIRAAPAGVFLEIGLSDTLSTLARLALAEDGQDEPTWLETLRWERDDVASTRLALAGAYTAGLDIDWAAVCAGGRMVTLPTYPFQRRRYWISGTRPADAPAGGADLDSLDAIDADAPDQADSNGPDHYLLRWGDIAPIAPAPTASSPAKRRCLVIAPSAKPVRDLVRELERLGAEASVHVPERQDDGAANVAHAMAEFRPDWIVNVVPAVSKRQADLGGLALSTDSAPDDIVAAGGRITLRVFQALSAANLTDVTVYTVTSGAHRVVTSDEVIPAQGAIIGIARTARVEYPGVRHVLIDLDAADVKLRWATRVVPRLAAVIGSPPAGEVEIALRGDRVLAPRLNRVTPRPGRVRIDPDGWYVVTGGLSGVGMECARALLELGARKLVLCGRRAPRQERAEQVRRLRRQFDADIRTELVDVTSRQQVDRLFAEYSSGDRAVRGVIHAAGLIDDGIIEQMDWSRVAGVLGPKAQGAWNLHRSAAEHAPDLDLFVMTSSSTGLFGNPGQVGHAAASAFLDALAGHRRAVGLPGLSLDLGAWSDVGYLAGNDGLLRRLEKQGVGTIPGSAGRRAVRGAMAAWSAGQAAILPTRWSDLDPEHHLASNPVVAELLGDRTEVSPAEPRSASAITSADILACCQEVICDVLGFDVEELGRLDLTNAGMDSLNALTIRNRLQRRLSLPLPALICFDKPTLGELVADIERRMAAHVAG